MKRFISPVMLALLVTVVLNCPVMAGYPTMEYKSYRNDVTELEKPVYIGNRLLKSGSLQLARIELSAHNLALVIYVYDYREGTDWQTLPLHRLVVIHCKGLHYPMEFSRKRVLGHLQITGGTTDQIDAMLKDILELPLDLFGSSSQQRLTYHPLSRSKQPLTIGEWSQLIPLVGFPNLSNGALPPSPTI